jgi:predicted chitinase
MLSAAQLQAIMPSLSEKRTRDVLPTLRTAMAEFAIEGARRTAAFLAQTSRLVVGRNRIERERHDHVRAIADANA